MLESEESGKLVDVILGLVASFKMKVTAERIESWEVARMLSARGCTQGQGYFVEKGMPAYQVFVLVQDGLSLAACGPASGLDAYVPDPSGFPRPEPASVNTLSLIRKS